MAIEIFNYSMEPWQIYASVGVFLIILEAFSPAFVFLPIGLGFLLTSALSPFINSWTNQFVVLAVSCTTIFLLFKRWLAPAFVKDNMQTNVGAMIGKTARVTEEVNPRKESGYVKLYGDRWRAISASGKVIHTGTKVTIKEVDGNKVIVE